MFQTQATAGRGLKETLLPPWTFNTGFFINETQMLFYFPSSFVDQPPHPREEKCLLGGKNIISQDRQVQSNRTRQAKYLFYHVLLLY